MGVPRRGRSLRQSPTPARGTIVGVGPPGWPLMVEPRLPIRLIALDIDGTLIGDDFAIAERTLAVVAEATRREIAVSLVTGRMATSATPFAQALGLTGPIVSQG